MSLSRSRNSAIRGCGAGSVLRSWKLSSLGTSTTRSYIGRRSARHGVVSVSSPNSASPSVSQPEHTSIHAPSPSGRRSACSNKVPWTANVIAGILSHGCSTSLEPDRARALPGQDVAGVGQGATAQAEAPAADAVGQVVAQSLQVHDAVVEILTPASGQPRPVLAGGDAVCRQRGQRVAPWPAGFPAAATSG